MAFLWEWIIAGNLHSFRKNPWLSWRALLAAAHRGGVEHKENFFSSSHKTTVLLQYFTSWKKKPNKQTKHPFQSIYCPRLKPSPRRFRHWILNSLQVRTLSLPFNIWILWKSAFRITTRIKKRSLSRTWRVTRCCGVCAPKPMVGINGAWVCSLISRGFLPPSLRVKVHLIRSLYPCAAISDDSFPSKSCCATEFKSSADPIGWIQITIKIWLWDKWRITLRVVHHLVWWNKRQETTSTFFVNAV